MDMGMPAQTPPVADAADASAGSTSLMDEQSLDQQPYLTFFDEGTAEYDVIVDQSSSALRTSRKRRGGALQPLLPLVVRAHGAEGIRRSSSNTARFLRASLRSSRPFRTSRPSSRRRLTRKC